jgi:uncharacterized protein (TIGR02594 family)
VKKQPVAKLQSVASVAAVKKASVAPAEKTAVASTMKTAVAPAKKVHAVRHHRAASVVPAMTVAAVRHARVAPAAVMPTNPIMFDRHGLSGYGDYSQQVQQAPQPTVRSRRPDKTAATQASRMPHFFASSDPVTEARRWIGSNPTRRNSLWCATFMNFVLERSGYSGTGSDAARSFASYGQRISGPQVGAIAVMTRGKNGGHVGIVSGFDASGNPIVISGNHGHRVAEAVYPRGRIYAYVLPR